MRKLNITSARRQLHRLVEAVEKVRGMVFFCLCKGRGDLISPFMPRFKPYDYRQSLMVPLNLEEQLSPGREWSGSFQELRFKADKLRRKLKEELAEHRRQDRLDRQRGEARSGPERAQEQVRPHATLEKLRRGAERIERFLKEEEPHSEANLEACATYQI